VVDYVKGKAQIMRVFPEKEGVLRKESVVKRVTEM
jgi:hypothetical protein